MAFPRKLGGEQKINALQNRALGLLLKKYPYNCYIFMKTKKDLCVIQNKFPHNAKSKLSTIERRRE
jgi:hypothetical protein